MTEVPRYNITTGRAGCDFIWYRVAKTGTRSVFAALRDRDVSFDMENGFQRPVPAGKYAGHFSFTFVRNPYARLVSGWQDKIIRGAGSDDLLALRERLKDFDVFVEWLAGQDPATVDIHFRPQSLLVPAELDFIGRTETLEDDLRSVLSQTGLDGDHEIPHRNASGKAWITAERMRPATRAQINELFAGDFERFGYPMLP